MYDELIIEEIRRRQNEEVERPQIQLPLPEPPQRKEKVKESEPKRVITIDTLDDDCDSFTFDI